MIPARHAPWHFPGVSSTWHIFSPATLTLQGYNWIIFGGLKLFLATRNHCAISLWKLVLLFFCCSFQRLLANRFCPTSLSIPSRFLHQYVWRNNISVQRHIWEITTKFRDHLNSYGTRRNFLVQNKIFYYVMLINSVEQSR